MKQWLVKDIVPEDAARELAEWPDPFRKILFHKGVKTKKEAEEFLNPAYDGGLHDPFLLDGMDKAVERISRAMKNNEKITVFGDYDADGICSCVIFHDFFKKTGFENFHVHIPDRFLEGYGLNEKAVDEFARAGTSLLITVDCGVTNGKEIEKANASGMDVVVIDHHLVQDGKTPPACAIIDPKKEDDNYPFKFLCGAGLAFKTVCALVARGGFNIVPGWERWLLDLVAVATVADMVPLVGENRVLTLYGLRKVMPKTQRSGLISFYNRLGINPSIINEEDLAFLISPRINVAGRMDHATLGYNLLTTDSEKEADWISGRLELLTADRKNQVEKISSAVMNKIGREESPKIIVDGSADWYPGVLGIAANKIMEKYGCPVFLWGRGRADKIRGSCRSNGSINLVDFMGGLPREFFSDFGGHAFSGGFTLNDGREDELGEQILDRFESYPRDNVENGFIFIDGEMKIDDMNWQFYSFLEKLRPFGVENEKPVFAFYDLPISEVRKFGNGDAHLQINFKKSGGENISAVGFFRGGDFSGLRSGQKINLAASLERNDFRGRRELRLRIEDIKMV
ncbi:MAG: single-stranded-DNA-specific exonuclease RecJ [Candidatus Pacebacteria bacterium]|nr:single-stranded-DNA-specific exonuclease RecJ [Candidatus Paceibacterota bacterium]NUQ56987.1 single-stranded-DNA-specific exonuclease RecJ [Candidatus Paceibacter sp.]